MKAALPEGPTCLARREPELFSKELWSLERKLDVATELLLPESPNEHEKED